jgi:hypothetical protein
MDPVVLEAVAAIGDRDWARLRPLLHPYLHWTGPDGRTTRGRANVLRQLGDGPAPGPPARYELRDGRVYRWVQQPPPAAS